jgi:hypothetical protein
MTPVDRRTLGGTEDAEVSVGGGARAAPAAEWDEAADDSIVSGDE